MRLVNDEMYAEYAAKRCCEWIICAICHRDDKDCFHVVSESADAGVGAQFVSYDAKREVFSGSEACTTWRERNEQNYKDYTIQDPLYHKARAKHSRDLYHYLEAPAALGVCRDFPPFPC